MYSITCRQCRDAVAEDGYHPDCPRCGGPLGFHYPEASWAPDASRPSMWRYQNILPVRPGSALITMQEGWTPLAPARCLPGVDLHFKNEARNPTGSHKDRPMSLAMTKAVELGRDTVMLYSDGSVALASAAYAAKAGLRSICVFGRGVPDYRLLPLAVYGAHLLEYQGTPAEALDWVHEACLKLGLFETTTYRLANPYSMEAPKTIGYEIYEQFGRAPDWLVVPTGGGATLAGIHQAFADLEKWGRVSRRPRMVGVVPRHYEMLATALDRDLGSDRELREIAPKEGADTIQVKIAMTYPPDGMEAVAAVRDSGGLFVAANDDEALAAQRTLGTREGIYAEPSAAVALVGVEKLVRMNKIKDGETVVAVVTGSGFRETSTIAGRVELKKATVDAGQGLTVLERILNGRM